MTKHGQKLSENMVFWTFKKIVSLVLSQICVKWKFLWFLWCILWKLHAWEKWPLANEISVFFNLQYFIDRLISDFDFWHVVDMREWKKQGTLTGFLKKFSYGESCMQKLCILISLDLLEELFKNDINNFQKKFVWGKWTILGMKMAHPHSSGSAVRFFLKILHNEKGQ